MRKTDATIHARLRCHNDGAAVELWSRVQRNASKGTPRDWRWFATKDETEDQTLYRQHDLEGDEWKFEKVIRPKTDEGVVFKTKEEEVEVRPQLDEMQVTTIHADGTRTVETVLIDNQKIERESAERLAERVRNVKAPSHYSAMEDRDLVVACLHYEGAIAHLVNDKIDWLAYCEGDGFGYLHSEDLAEINDGWDWSHVRDSTPEGFHRMAQVLRRNLGAIFA